MRFRLASVLLLAAAFAFGPLGANDLTITFSSKGKGMLGSGKTTTEIHYYTPEHNLVQGVDTKMDSLVDFPKGMTYSIDHKKKTVSAISFDDAMDALDQLDASKGKGLGAMMGNLFGDPNDCKVEKLEKETVAGRECQIWKITVGKLNMTLSADPTLKMPVPDAAYARMIKARATQFAKAGPMGAVWKRLYEEMSKIKGVPLKTHMTGMMGMDVTSEATKIDTGAIPAATFALPEGYPVKDAGKELREQLAKAN
jgi:hypothetical protein